jgi:hypothetical protein
VRAQLGVAWARREAGVRRSAVERAALQACLPALDHAGDWTGGIAPLLGARPGARPWRFRRGFVEEVQLDAAHFLKVAPALYARAPVIDLVLRGVRDVLPALAASPHLARVRSLDLAANHLEDADLAALLHSPQLGRLRWLSLYHNRLGDRSVRRLAAARAVVPHLRFVRWDGNPCADPNPVADEEGGRVYGLHRSTVEAELRERYGAVPWLGDNPSADPPDPETFD